MRNYLDLMARVLDEGERRLDRTGVGTRSLFSTQLSFDLREGFPAVTTKRLAFGPVKAELTAFLRGYDNLEDFHNVGCRIWDANAHSDYWQANPNCLGRNDLGRIYGVQWRRWKKNRGTFGSEYVDQLRDVVERIKINPTDRRLLVTAWNPGELDEMCLPPCHLMYQFYAGGDEFLDIKVYMRSVDVFIGMPFDIASYALLLELVARTVGRRARHLHMDFADTHIYLNHLEQVKEQLSRRPHVSPVLDLAPIKDFDDFMPSQATLAGYVHHAPIKAPMNV